MVDLAVDQLQVRCEGAVCSAVGCAEWRTSVLEQFDLQAVGSGSVVVAEAHTAPKTRSGGACQ